MRSAVCLTVCLALVGCATIRNIPANSTPLREARYLRTQDVANFAGGIVVDELARLVFPGPRACTDGRAQVYDARGYGMACQSWHPIWRLGMVTTVALARRQLDRGYRESGALFNLSGALLWEIIRCATSSGCDRPRRR